MTRLSLPLLLALLTLLPALAGCADEFVTDAASANAKGGASCVVDGPASLEEGTSSFYEAADCLDGSAYDQSWTLTGPVSIVGANDSKFVNILAGSVSSPTSATLTYTVRTAGTSRVLQTVSKTITVTPAPQPPVISGLDEVGHIAAYGGCQPSYTVTNGPATWTVTGPATFSPWASGNGGILTTTNYGTATLTATTAGGTTTKAISINRFSKICP